MLLELVTRNRSYRRFKEEVAVERALIENLIDLARLSASGSNAQPLKFVISKDPETNSRIFPTLSWAGYLKDWPGPKEGERPAAYIVILLDKTVRKDAGCDHGIAAQSMLLGATEAGLGGCMLGSIRRQELCDSLGIPEHFEVLLVIALGTPAESVEIETVGNDGDIKYWRDADGVHHVPKRTLDELIVEPSPK